jgi:SAM-dependent methyltransferase
MRATARQYLKQHGRRAVGEPYVGKRLKRRWVRSRLPEIRPAQVIDVGSEDASFTYWFADRWPQAQITALDIDPDIVAACQAVSDRRYAGRVRFVCGEIGELPAASADVVIAFDVLEHVVDDRGLVAEIGRVLRPRGLLLVHVPAERYVDVAGVVHWVADEDAWMVTEGHVRAGYSPEALTRLVRSAGFEVLTVERWNRRWSARAFVAYHKLEHPAMLRLFSLPITDACAMLDRRRPEDEGNTVWLVARPNLPTLP